MNLREHRTLITVDLLDRGGISQYQLVCFSGDETANLELHRGYSGGLSCGLAPTGTPVAVILREGSLLITDGEPDARYSRGIINPPALVGRCANYPDFGLVRTFALRGFRLTLTVSDIEVRPDYKGDWSYKIDHRKDFPIGRMKLTVTVEPDPKATSARALTSEYVDPDDDQLACAKPITEWPILQSVSKEITLNLRSYRTFVKVDLKDITGQSQYQFICFAGDEEASKEFDVIYTGGLLCGLANTGTPVDLVLENNPLLSTKYIHRGIFSRSNFNPEELIGDCANYPDYGLTRDFSLRGFRLTLKMSEVEVSPDYEGQPLYFHPFFDERSEYPIGHLKLTVSVIPDPKARSASALPSKYAYPKGGQEACAKPILEATEK